MVEQDTQIYENRQSRRSNVIVNIIVNFFVRAAVGLVMIFFINIALENQQIDVHVGLNPVSFVATGAFGVPGVALLYGIAFY